MNYTYDGDGLRAEKSSGTLYWRTYTGQVIEETDTSGNPTADYDFFGGRRIAWWSSTGNSLENPGFESGSAGWSVPSSCSWCSGSETVSDDPAVAHSGSYYLSASWASGVWVAASGTNGSQWIPVSPGQQIVIGGWIKRTGGTGNLDFDCEIVDSNYNFVAWCNGAILPDGNGGTSWQRYSGTTVAPANAAYVMAYAEIHCCGDSDTSTTSGDFDDAYLGVGGVYYRFADATGGTSAVTDSSGSVCFSADYYPYGQENDYDTSCSPEFRFAGYQYDSESGNYYAMARYYNPRLGRFMSPDPLGGSVGNPQSLNRYSYVLNNPESFVDPLGLKCVTLDDGTRGDDGTLPKCNDPSVWTSETVTVNGGGGETPSELYQLLWEAEYGLQPTMPPLVYARLSPFGVGPRPARPNKRQTQAQASKQEYDSCVAGFNNSTVGKAASFFSLLDLPSHLWEWFGLGGAKALGVEALDRAEQSAAVTDYSITGGTAAEAVPLVGSKVLGVAGGVATATGTAVDLGVRWVCYQAADPELYQYANMKPMP